MGKKKRNRKRPYRGRKRGKKSRSSAAKHSAAVEGGLGITLYKVATDKITTGASPIDALKASGDISYKLQDVASRASKNALAWDNAKWVLGGMAIHWAKNKPIAKIVLKPADGLVKLLAGKRYGL